jgi:hypothetical protein
MTITKQTRGWDEIRARLGAQKPALTFTGIPLDYWREEVRLGCTASLGRLRRIVEQRGADWDKTIAALQED